MIPRLISFTYNCSYGKFLNLSAQLQIVTSCVSGTWYSFGKPNYWFDTGFHFGELVMPAVYLVLVGVLFRFLVKALNKPTVRVKQQRRRDGISLFALWELIFLSFGRFYRNAFVNFA